MWTAEKAQTEVLGSVLMTSVIVLTVTIFGSVLIADYTDDVKQSFLDAEINVTTDRVNVTHFGGNDFENSNLDVVISNSSTSIRRDFENTNHRADTLDDDMFSPGETASFNHSLTGDITVLVIDTRRETVLERADDSV